LVTLTAFSVIGLVLVVIGVFSVMGYTVALRTREIGIRMGWEHNREMFFGSCYSTASVW
jgi:hypothetical protein